MLIKTPQVTAITGLYAACIHELFKRNSFPKPVKKERHMYWYDESEVKKWLVSFESTVLEEWWEGSSLQDIKDITRVSKNQILKVLKKYGAIQGVKKPKLENPFKMFLTISANLRNKLS